MTSFFSSLPAGWRTSPLKMVTDYLGRGLAPSYVDDGPVRVVNQAVNRGSHLDWSKAKFHATSLNPRNLKSLLNNSDIIINSTGTGTLGRVGFFERSPGGRPAVADSHVTVVRVRENELVARYAYYVLSSSRFYEFMYSSMVVGSTNQIELSRERLGSTLIPLPNLDEQRRIADFLDSETSKIDKILALRNRQLGVLAERLREQVRSLTRGTGTSERGGKRLVPWLGMVPNEWPLVKINRIGKFYMGTTFPHQYQGSRVGDFPFVKVADFSGADTYGRILSAENWIDRTIAYTLRARIVPAGSVVYARVGAALLLNQRRILGCDSVVDDNVRAIKFRGGDPRYWMHLFSFVDLARVANPGPVPSVGESQVSSLFFPVPGDTEQNDIANEIDRIVTYSKDLDGLLKRQVELLEERKCELIVAAVTGKIDVTTARGADLS